MQSDNSASNSGSKRPTYTRAGGNWLGEGKLPGSIDDPSQLFGMGGFFGDVGAQQMFPIEQLFGGLTPLIDAGNQGGAVLRNLSSGATDQAYKNTMNLGTQAAGLGDSSTYFMNNQAQQGGMGEWGQKNNDSIQNYMGNMFGVATDFANKGINPALTAGNQTLQNVMNPTVYNPLFQNASQNLNNTINSSMAARGMAMSGPATEALRQGNQDLADSFAQRQFGEQLAAQNQLGNLGMQSAQVPGQVFNQFAQGIGQGIQNIGMGQQNIGMGLGNYGSALNNLGMASQQQMNPLQALGLGGGVFSQGLNMPLSMASGLYNLTRTPLNALGNFVNSVPNISNSNTSGFFSSLFQ